MNGLEYIEHSGMEEVDGIYKLGKKYDSSSYPQEGIATVKYSVRLLPDSAFLDSTDTRNTPLTFELNSGQVLEGFNRAVKNLRIGDSALFVVPPSLAYGKNGKLGIVPPNAWLMYDIELESVAESKNTPESILAMANKTKEQGNNFFRDGQIDLATTAYGDAIRRLEYLEVESQSKNDILIACYSNMAAVYLKEKQLDEAINSCNKVFSLDPYHVKASFRIGHAYLEKKEFETGIEIVQRALEKHPNEITLKQTLKTLKEKTALENARQRKAYARMFN